MIGGLQDRGGGWSVDEIGVCSNRDKSSVKFCTERGAGVIANESAEGCIYSRRAGTVESVADKAGPADSLTRSCEPLVYGAAA